MYKNPNLSSDERARDLLSQMTIDEKIDQMVFFEKIAEVYDGIKAGEDVACRAGMWADLNNTHREDPINVVQDYFVNKTRLGIPAVIGFEALHGLYYSKATVFPQNAGIGGSFNLDNYRKMSEIIGEECRATGIRQVFSPVLDIPRDPRWGRFQEAYSEDPYLVGEMGAEYVKGVQKSGVATTLKHYLAYGVPENGLNCCPSHIGEREIREVMLEPFKKCIDAGALSVMPAYNEIDGEPCHSSVKYLKDVLRGELGFNGVTIADWGGVNMLHSYHRVAENLLEAGKMSLEAGLDIEESKPFGYGEDFRNAVKNGEIDIKLIDEAVYRVLKMKFEIGLFEDAKYHPEDDAKMHRQEAVELSRKIDEESILLLKNDGILPLDEKKVGKVAVIGNNAKDSFIGDYIGKTPSCVSFYDGILNRLGEDRVLYSKGCNHITTTDEMVSDAVKTAKNADVVMLVLGDCSPSGGGEFGVCDKSDEYTVGEGFDAHDLNLSPSQRTLFEEIIKIGKPTILIYYTGRACAIKDAVDRVNGFMLSWGGGEQNGNAFANLIFGDKTPSAKLSFSLPMSVGTLPCYYNYKASARGLYKKYGTIEKPGRDYVLSTPQAWMPFGFGLSYTKIEYSALCAEKNGDGTITVRVDVKNEGDYEIDESVLLFVSMMYCPITPFVKKLRKFKKVNLMPGEKKTVDFTLTDEDFTYIDKDMKTVVNEGTHKILIDTLECTVELGDVKKTSKSENVDLEKPTFEAIGV